jgi:hypothetical protein
MCVHVCVCGTLCARECAYARACISVCVRAHVSVCVYVFVYMCVHALASIYKRECIPACHSLLGLAAVAVAAASGLLLKPSLMHALRLPVFYCFVCMCV